MAMTITKPSVLCLGLMALLTLVLVLLSGFDSRKDRPAPGAASVPVARVIFFGDSITAAGDQPGGYVSIIRDTLKQDYPTHSLEVLGAGIGGNTVPDLQARVDQDVIAREPTHVVIYIGINDVWQYEFAGPGGTEPGAYEQGLRDLIVQVQATGAGVSLCTPSVIGEDPDSTAPVNQRLRDYAEISRTVATTSGAYLCDLRTAFEQYLRTHNPDRVYEGILTSDGVHLNDRGNRLVADVLLAHLRPLVGQSLSSPVELVIRGQAFSLSPSPSPKSGY
jgi:lysophospholipase L1-like esterase